MAEKTENFEKQMTPKAGEGNGKKSTKKTAAKKTTSAESKKIGYVYCSNCGSRQKINGKCKICDK